MLKKIQAQCTKLKSPKNQILYDTWISFEGSIDGKQLALTSDNRECHEINKKYV